MTPALNPWYSFQSDYYSQAEEMWRSVVGEEGKLRIWDETLLSLREVLWNYHNFIPAD